MKTVCKILKIFLLVLIVAIVGLAILFFVRMYKMGARNWAGVVDIWQKEIVETKPKLNKIVFIREGNIWTVNPDGSEEKPLTAREKTIIAIKKHETCSELSCGTYDPELWYNADFFEHPTISPDGAHLAIMGYSNHLAEVIRSEDKDLKSKYLAGDYWIPAHHDLYIFDLINGSQRIIPLEDNPLDTDERIERIYWQKDNTKVFLSTVNNHLFSVSIPSGKIEKAKVELYIPSSFHYALIPASNALVYWDSLGSARRGGQLNGLRLWDLQAPEQHLLTFPETEKSYGSVVSGVNGKIFFWTTVGDQYVLYWFSPVGKENKYGELFRATICTDDPKLRPCIALPGTNRGLDSIATGEISTTGKYFLGSTNVTLEAPYESEEKDIYRVSDLQKIFDLGDYSDFNWGYDGESLVARKNDGNLYYISLSNGSVKQITQGGGVSSYFGFDWNYLN